MTGLGASTIGQPSTITNSSKKIEWSIRMIQKRSLMGGPGQLPPTPDMKREKIEKQVILNKNEFE